MMYIHEPSLAALKADLAAFIAGAIATAPPDLAGYPADGIPTSTSRGRVDVGLRQVESTSSPFRYCW